MQPDRHGDDSDARATDSAAGDETTVFRAVAPHETETTVFRAAPPADETAVFQAVPTAVSADDDRAYAAKPYRSRPRRGVRFRMVVAFAMAIAVAVGAAVVVGVRSERHDTDPFAGIATDTPDLKRPPQRDFSLETCTITRDGALVSGTVTNRSPDRADYALDAVLVDQNGTVITQGIATVAGVDPGAKAPWQTTLPPRPSTASQTECKVVKIDRYRSKS